MRSRTLLSNFKFLLYATSIFIITLGIAHWPTTTHYGVNYKYSIRVQPLYQKAIHFLSRHYETQSILRLILQEINNSPDESMSSAPKDEILVMRLYEWTHAQIHPTPPGFFVQDDHILYTLIRRYGASDQQALVLALLANYSGFESACVALKNIDSGASIKNADFTVIKLKDRLVALDVWNGVAIREPNGRLADLNQARSDLGSGGPISRNAASYLGAAGSKSYLALLKQLSDTVPDFGKIKAQNPWSRFSYEFRK